MRRFLFWALLALFVVTVGAMAAFMLVPQSKIGGDFDLRVNEISCLLEGVDPYDVWSGKVEHAPYYPMERADMRCETFTRRVNAYPPWAYTFGLPLVMMSERVAWHLYFACQILILVWIGVAGFRSARGAGVDIARSRLVSVAALLLTVFAVGSCFQSGNYPLVVLAALLGMIWCLERGHDVLAGVCWALAMIKPQMALLLSVPLLLRRKFLTCAVAAVLCLIASVPPMLVCHKGFFALLSNGIKGSSNAFMGCGTLPGFLVPVFGQSLSINLALALGLLICAVLTWRTPRYSNWFVYLTPAAVIASLWTYSQLYASVVCWFAFVLIGVALARHPKSKVYWLVFALAAVFLSRAYTFYHGFTMLFPVRFGYSWELHGLLDSINSFLGLVVFVWFWSVSVRKSLWQSNDR